MDVRHYPSFAELVKAIRKRQRLSQRSLAKLLDVSPGYVGQWELHLSQPSPEVVERLCRSFEIDDREHVQRLAFAERAPDWLKASIISYSDAEGTIPLAPLERRILDAARRLPADRLQLLAERVEGWVDGLLESVAK